MKRPITEAQRDELRALARLSLEVSSAQRAAHAAHSTQLRYIAKLHADIKRQSDHLQAFLHGRDPAAALRELEELGDTSDMVNTSADYRIGINATRKALHEMLDAQKRLPAELREAEILGQRAQDATQVSYPIDHVLRSVIDYLGATRDELGLNFNPPRLDGGAQFIGSVP